jgi:hypothetical protein
MLVGARNHAAALAQGQPWTCLQIFENISTKGIAISSPSLISSPRQNAENNSILHRPECKREYEAGQPALIFLSIMKIEAGTRVIVTGSHDLTVSVLRWPSWPTAP